MSIQATLIAAARGDAVDIPSGVDWPALLKAAEDEGMTALLARAARGSAEELRPLRVRAGMVAARASQMLEELARIQQAFDAAGVRMLPYKGPLLSQQLYGRHDLRAFSDLDLIVAPADAARGERILRTLGYHEPERLERWTHRRFNSETVLVHDELQIAVDFHWRFGNVQFPVPLTFDDAWSRRGSVLGLPTLGDDDLALVVTTHAAKHLWHKLEFLAQLAALVRRGERGVPAVHRLLVRDFLGTDIGDVPMPEKYSAIHAIVSGNLFNGATRKTDASGRDLFLLFDSRAAVLRALAVSVFVPTHADWAGSKAPTMLHWLLRPLRLVRKYLKMHTRR
ncbi:MAG TPA: nucleotidyltransferase family protein [Thermoanaerobaculia bacterium]